MKIILVCLLLAGCKSACNRHGTCALEDGEYHCVCSDGWAGLDCSIRLEMECNDEIDNDEGMYQKTVYLYTIISGKLGFITIYCFYVLSLIYFFKL